jgi:hypothetical protein
MDFEHLLTQYRALWQQEHGERDEATYRAIVEALEQDTPLEELQAWAASQHLSVDKDTWKIYHVFLDELSEVERTEAARASDASSREMDWRYLEGTDAAWHV